MRIPLLSFALVLKAALALGQDPGSLAAQQANQQAMQAAQMANQQAMQAAQMANQQAMQQAQTTAIGEGLTPGAVPRPRFSVKPGTYASPLTVKIKAPRETTVYFTTDGWTPTKDSTRYTGPITVESTTTIQAIAVYNGLWHSIPASATYTVRQDKGSSLTRPETAALTYGTAPSVPSSQATVNRVLAQGTPVRLVFTSDLSSKKADVGDKIPL